MSKIPLLIEFQNVSNSVVSFGGQNLFLFIIKSLAMAVAQGLIIKNSFSMITSSEAMSRLRIYLKESRLDKAIGAYREERI